MSDLGQLIACGKFTSDGTAKNIVLRSSCDHMRTINYTQQATTQTTGRGIQFDWQSGLADGYGFMISKKDTSNDVTFEVISTNGFTLVDTSNQTPEAAKATSGTDVTTADPAVVTITSHGYSTGDRIRMYGTTGMLQIAGMEFTITKINDNSFSLTYLDSSGFSAVATAGFARRIPNNPLFVPAANWITDITAANPAVVTLSVTHNLAVDDMVRLIVPEAFGMVEADGLQAKVTAVDTSNNTVTLDLDSSGFTTFAFPASSEAPFTFAQLTPFGDVANGVDQALVNDSKIVMRLGAGADAPAGSSSDVIYWQAYKSALVDNE